MKKLATTLCAIALSGCSVHFNTEARAHFHASAPEQRYSEPQNRQWEQNYRLDWNGRPTQYGRDEDQIQPRYRNR